MKLKKGPNNKYGYVDNKTGQWVIQPMYSKATEFNDHGIAIVAVADNRNIIINEQNKNVTGKIYSIVEFMYHGYMRATEINVDSADIFSRNQQNVFLDPNGREIEELRNVYVIEVSQHGTVVYTYADKYGAYNLNTGQNIQAEYSRIFDFIHDGGPSEYAVVYKEDKAGMIDWDNNVIIPFEYQALSPYRSLDIVIAKQNEIYGALDFKGNLIYPFEFTSYSASIDEIRLNKIVTTYIKANK